MMNMTILNRGAKPTFQKPGFGESIPDITFASGRLAAFGYDWRAMDDYTGSGHNYITFDLSEEGRTPVNLNRKMKGWNVAKLDADK